MFIRIFRMFVIPWILYSSEKSEFSSMTLPKSMSLTSKLLWLLLSYIMQSEELIKRYPLTDVKAKRSLLIFPQREERTSWRIVSYLARKKVKYSLISSSYCTDPRKYLLKSIWVSLPSKSAILHPFSFMKYFETDFVILCFLPYTFLPPIFMSNMQGLL